MNENLFYRGLSLRGPVNKSERSVNLSFSSETPAKRWFGTEILLHGPGNVDLSRLKALGAALMNHNPAVIVGPLKNVRIEDKKGKAKVIFDEDADGEKAFGKVQSGSLKGASVGYTVQKFREVLRDEDYILPDSQTITGPAMIATRWTPHEVSLTSIPLDATIGVGRALTRSLDGITIEKSNFKKESIAMRNQPVIKDEKTREVLGALYRTAQLIGGLEFKSDVIDASIDESGFNLYRAADLLNRKLDEIGEKAEFHKSENSSAFEPVISFKQVSDESFIKSLLNPLLIKPSIPKVLKKRQTGTRPQRTSFEQVDDKTFIESLKSPSMSF